MENSSKTACEFMELYQKHRIAVLGVGLEADIDGY